MSNNYSNSNIMEQQSISMVSRQEIRTIYPVIFIGLGTTGAKIVSNIFHNFNNSNYENRFKGYIAVTSEVLPDEGVDTNNIKFISLANYNNNIITSTSVIEMFSNTNDLKQHFHSWWHKVDDNLWYPKTYSLDSGAGGVRPMGRLLLHIGLTNGEHSEIYISLENIINRFKIESQKTSLDSALLGNPVNVNLSKILFYIFGTLAGGTCSGIFLDFPYIIRKIAHANSIEPLICGAFLLGDTCQAGVDSRNKNYKAVELQLRNTLYALCEAKLIHSTIGFEIVKNKWVKRIGRLDISEKAIVNHPPYHRLAFMGKDNDMGISLSNYDEYIKFVAQYYALRYSYSISREVDNMAVIDAERSYPPEPNNFVRFGMLNLYVPKNKIWVILKDSIKEKIVYKWFKNDQKDNVSKQENQAIINAFKNNINLEKIEEVYTPKFSYVKLNDLPKNKNSFLEYWTTQLNTLAERYKNEIMGESKEYKEKFVFWQNKVNSAIQVLLNDCLDTADLCKLKYLLTGLKNELEVKKMALENEVAPRKEYFFGQHKEKISKIIERVSNDFPEKSLLNPIDLIRRMWWDEYNEIYLAMNDYIDECSKLTGMVLGINILDYALKRLRSIDTAEKIFSHEIFEPVMKEVTNEKISAFKDKDLAAINELFSTEDEIKKILVSPLLEKLDPSNRNRYYLDHVMDLLYTKLKSEHSSLQEIINELEKIVSEDVDGKKVEQSEGDPKIEKFVKDKRQVFRDAFHKTVFEAFDRQIRDLTIWDAIGNYIQEMKKKDERCTPLIALHILFKGFGQRFKLYPKLSYEHVQQMTSETPSLMILIYNHEKACDMLKKMDVRDPDIELAKLFENALGISSQFLNFTKDDSRIVILYEKVGVWPQHFHGYSRIKDIFEPNKNSKNEEIEKRQIEQLSWSDRRFPSWIEKWREETQKLMKKPEKKKDDLNEEVKNIKTRKKEGEKTKESLQNQE